jgi:hypothetical protein
MANTRRLEFVSSVPIGHAEPCETLRPQAADRHIGTIAPAFPQAGNRARLPVLFPAMEQAVAEPVARVIRRQVEHARAGTFLRCRDFPGGPRAVESALSRLAAEGELVRVRRGLYWRGTRTRFGMVRPSALDVALEIGGTGSGPSGVAAARMLGLTTQVPAAIEVAVPGKSPEPLAGVRFRSRPFTRRERKLRPIEVAVLELLRDPHAVGADWAQVACRIRELIADGAVRAAALGAAAAEEPRVEARARWASLAAVHPHHEEL